MSQDEHKNLPVKDGHSPLGTATQDERKIANLSTLFFFTEMRVFFFFLLITTLSLGDLHCKMRSSYSPLYMLVQLTKLQHVTVPQSPLSYRTFYTISQIHLRVPEWYQCLITRFRGSYTEFNNLVRQN